MQHHHLGIEAILKDNFILLFLLFSVSGRSSEMWSQEKEIILSSILNALLPPEIRSSLKSLLSLRGTRLNRAEVT